jgi:hypothetical protein
LRTVLSAVLLTASVLHPVRGAHAQDTEFSGDQIAEAPCPPAFSAVYHHPQSGKTYFDTSRLTMRQYDEYHASVLYSYSFVGYTADQDWRITGVHHVAAGQCTSAAYSYWTGSPAVIAYLHNAKVQATGTGGGGGEGEGCGDFDQLSYQSYGSPSPIDPESYIGGGSGGGGGDDEESDADCPTEYVIIEVSYDNGVTWQVWWEGEISVCE